MLFLMKILVLGGFSNELYHTYNYYINIKWKKYATPEGGKNRYFM